MQDRIASLKGTDILISLLARIFIGSRGLSESDERQAYGVLCGAVGIGLNILLFLGKFLAGTLSHSIAITADAFNNLSDAGSSVVTLLGFRFAGQEADKDHPFGHGRIEYLSGLAVALLILLMAFELFKSSLEKILNPTPVESSPLVLLILCASIAVKLYMSLYNRSIGRKINSPAMEATAADSLGDCVSTAAVLVATLIGQFTGLMIDGWAGLLVALFIFWAGINAAKETIDPLLGVPPTEEFVQQIYDIAMGYESIVGIHDLIVHDYGPGRCMISLHAEVPADRNILDIHDEIDNAERELARVLNCHAVIHMDPLVVNDDLTSRTRQAVLELVHTVDSAISIHDFRMVEGPTHTNVIFDATVPHRFRLSDGEVTEAIQAAVRSMEGNYFAVVTVERSFV